MNERNKLWDKEDIQEFAFLCCPNCEYVSNELIAYQDHILVQLTEHQSIVDDRCDKSQVKIDSETEPVLSDGG